VKLETIRNAALALAAYPEFAEKLLWGGRVVGVRIVLATARAAAVKTLVRQAYGYQSAKPGRAAARTKRDPAIPKQP